MTAQATPKTDAMREMKLTRQRERMAELRAQRKAEKDAKAAAEKQGGDAPTIAEQVAAEIDPNPVKPARLSEPEPALATVTPIAKAAPAKSAKKAPAKSAKKSAKKAAPKKSAPVKSAAPHARLQPGEAPAPEVGEEGFHCPKCNRTVKAEFKAKGRNACKPCYNAAFAEWKAKQA